MIIRKAVIEDIDGIIKLLEQVHDIHVDIRPDIFKRGYTKYGKDELIEIIHDENKPIYVAVDEKILGYIFCVFKTNNNESLHPIKTLYIDDFCVLDEYRHKHIGTSLYEYIKELAKKMGCYNITLNVWEGNDDALNFYKKLGLTTQKRILEETLI